MATKKLWEVGGLGGAGTVAVQDTDGTPAILINGTQVLTARGDAITDALTGGSATAANCATTINLILARLRAAGIIAT